MPDVVLVGGGGHAAVLLAVLTRLGHRVIGYAAPGPKPARVALAYLGSDDDLAEKYATTDVTAALGLGKTRVDDRRMQVLTSLARAGLRFPPIVAPSATVHAGVNLGDGTVVLDGAVVATGARLGRGCIVNTLAGVDHDAVLGDDVHVAPGATVCGDVVIGDHCLIAAGATLIQGIRVPTGTLIAAGATVVSDIREPGTYLGTPARRVR